MIGRIVSGESGAELKTIGNIGAVRHLYEDVIARLQAQGIEPMHRQAGLRPHITLGYGACDFPAVATAWRWTPRELALIKSHVGHCRHRVLQRWTLLPPAQGSFAFMEDELPPPLRYAA